MYALSRSTPTHFNRDSLFFDAKQALEEARPQGFLLLSQDEMV
jgi:hypothetical protein